MAGEWLKFDASTPDKPEVLAITVAMGWDDPDLTVGKLLRVWRWFDQQTIDGNAHGVTPALLDCLLGVSGLCEAMAKVGWLVITDSGLSLPNFGRHNGKTAKDRALTAKRVANHKTNAKGNAEGNAAIVSDALPREEKNREDINPPNPPVGGEEPVEPSADKPKRERKTRIALKTFLENCRSSGEKAISDYRPLLEYVEGTGLPMEFVQLAWNVFKAEHSAGGRNEARLQADWRRHFLNYVEKGYYRLWYASAEGAYSLSTVGIQAQTLHQHREAA